MTLTPTSKESGAGSEGVLVTAVHPRGPAANLLKIGDTILEVAVEQVSTPGDFNKAIDGLRQQGKRIALLWVKAGGGTRFVVVPVGHH